MPRSSVWLATGLSAPEDIVVDATTVYWTSPGDNTIRSIDKMGGTVIRLADALSPPRRLALDEAYVYWSEDLGGAIMRTRKDGSGTPELVTPAITPLSIVVDSANVYWGSGLNVMTAPKTGGGPVTTFAVLPSDRSRDIVDIKSDGATLFVMDRFPSAGGTWKVELRDGSVSLFLHHGSAVRPSVSALDSTRFYQSGGENIRTIGWVDKADGRNPGLNVYWGVSIEYVAVTACDILWTNTQQLNLSLRDAGGQESPAYWTIFTVDASQVPVRRMAVDESNLYWTSASAIGKIPAR